MRTVIIFLVCLIITDASAQELSMPVLDSTTYSLFLKKEYSKLIQLGNEAIEDETDFFALRMRLGIAYFELKNYEEALTHFHTAYQMNPWNENLQEYLYYTYLYTNRVEDANTIAEFSSETFRKRIQSPTKIFDYLLIDIGGVFNNNTIANQKVLLKTPLKLSGLNQYFGNAYFGDVSTRFTIANRLHTTIGFSFASTLGEGYLSTQTIEQTNRIYNFHYQFNLLENVVFEQGWELYIGGAAYLNAVTLIDIFNYTSLATSSYSFNSYLVHIGVAKRFPYIQPSLDAYWYYSTWIRIFQLQGEFSIIYYPFGDVLFGTSALSYNYNQDGVQFYNTPHQFVFTQKINGKIITPLRYELSFTYGNHYHYISSHGFSFYNSSDIVDYTIGTSFLIYISKIMLNIGYKLQEKNSFFDALQANTDGSLHRIQKKYIYFEHILTLSLLWNF